MSKKILDKVYGGVVEQVHPNGSTVIFQVGNDLAEITLPNDQFSTPPRVNTLISVHVIIGDNAPKDAIADDALDEWAEDVFDRHTRRNTVKLPHEF